MDRPGCDQGFPAFPALESSFIAWASRCSPTDRPSIALPISWGLIHLDPEPWTLMDVSHIPVQGPAATSHPLSPSARGSAGLL